MRNYIYVTYGGDKESFRRESLGGETDNGVLFEKQITFSDNSLGYFLCQLLDMDMDTVLRIIESYDLDGSPLKWLNARNEGQVHESLLAYSELYRLYEPGEYVDIWSDHVANRPALPLFLERLRKYLDYCEQERLPYHGEFFQFLLGNSYFGDEITLRYQDDIPPMHAYFLEYTRDINKADDLDVFRAIFLAEKNVNRHSESRTYTISSWSNRLAIAALASLRELSLRGKVVRKCANCGRYFIPENRSDTLYCDRMSPQDPNMDCKTYASQRLWYQKQKLDELAVLSRNVLSAKGMLASRNPDIPAYRQSYDYFRKERLKWKAGYETGEISAEDYRNWLLSMREQKIIKEALDGNS